MKRQQINNKFLVNDFFFGVFKVVNDVFFFHQRFRSVEFHHELVRLQRNEKKALNVRFVQG